MSDVEPWVVVWAVPKRPLDVPCWLMVNHIDRGWELPGGKITGGESFDIPDLFRDNFSCCNGNIQRSWRGESDYRDWHGRENGCDYTCGG